MASHRLRSLFLLVLVHASSLLPVPVQGGGNEDDLLQGLNSYRTASNLTKLAKNKKAACLADEIAIKIEDKKCVPKSANTVVTDNGAQFGNYTELLKKCDINPNSTRDGIILPVCVPKLVPTLVFTNYTLTAYVKYVNDSRFSGAGIGVEKDWIVLVLTTNSTSGNFTSGVGGEIVNWLLGMWVMWIVFSVLFN